MGTALIGLDWGTTAFRAYRIGADGVVLERAAAPAGILQVEGGDFEGALLRAIGGWLEAEPGVPVLAAGMIGSRQGWIEVPYAACPAGVEDLAGALARHGTAAGRTIHFVPGASFVGEDGVPDVMRGEETEIAGALGERPGPALLVLPGTHSKWVRAGDGRITGFATFMTGELFDVLRRHSILGRLMEGHEHDPDAFRRGLACAGPDGSGLLKRLFSARTLGLFGELEPRATASYLSGLLIGTEIAEALAWTAGRGGGGREVMVVGTSALAGLYAGALEVRGLRPERAPEDAAARGLFRIAAAGGLLR